LGVDRRRRGGRLALLIAFGLCACARQTRRAHDLPANGTWTGTFDFAAETRLDFQLDVPSDAVAVRVEFRSEVVELEYFADPQVIDDATRAAFANTEPEPPRRFDLVAIGPDPLAGTRWFFSALWPHVTPPRVGERVLSAAPLSVTVCTHAARRDAELDIGTPLRSELTDASGGFKSFQVQVPDGAEALRIDLFDVTSNLDLYARAGGPILASDASVAFAEHGWGHETLVIDARSEPPLRSGPWTVDVYDALGPTRTLSFAIVASLSREVPAALLALPELPVAAGTGPLARALAAVVELATDDGIGSGTLLSSDGWILTNEHVVGSDPALDIVVSLTTDPTEPPQEGFRARLMRADVERDLALVRIVGGLYGQPLPADYALPTLALGEPARLAIGDPLWLVGYPTTGGIGSRVTESATRGILAGFERADFGVLLKTDAEITDGNSGGAALDEHGFLIGVPSATVENGSGQIGYVNPISNLPEEWRALLRR
jgi:S1-C subfamily serine protease